ncbi:hypothetical protein ACFWWB_01525 [Streptomyces sp. NPDC058690]|uniref:hypothetical protein n=1 Tax=unclassified Streptomyces TaxID=2593676 RepID=UPI003666165A
MVELVSLTASLVSLIVAYLALVYTARPKARIRLLSGDSFPAGQAATLTFRVTVRSRLKRTAADMRIYVNFPGEVDVRLIRFGSALERVDTNARQGKGGAKYVTATGVRVSKREPVKFEDFEVEIVTPQQSGKYKGWTTAFAHGSADDCGTDQFEITVRP